MVPPHLPPVLFGGPGQPARVLRDWLRRLVDAAPAGSAIDRRTCFRDLALAAALIAASDRGVRVRTDRVGDARTALMARRFEQMRAAA